LIDSSRIDFLSLNALRLSISKFKLCCSFNCYAFCHLWTFAFEEQYYITLDKRTFSRLPFNLNYMRFGFLLSSYSTLFDSFLLSSIQFVSTLLACDLNLWLSLAFLVCVYSTSSISLSCAFRFLLGPSDLDFVETLISFLAVVLPCSALLCYIRFWAFWISFHALHNDRR
jgi:hypothetical protein